MSNELKILPDLLKIKSENEINSILDESIKLKLNLIDGGKTYHLIRTKSFQKKEKFHTMHGEKGHCFLVGGVQSEKTVCWIVILSKNFWWKTSPVKKVTYIKGKEEFIILTENSTYKLTTK